MRRVSVFGSTGSIGTNTIDLLERQGGRAAYDVRVLTGGRNIETLAQQARDLGAAVAVTCFDDLKSPLADLLGDTDTVVTAGAEALVEAACEPTDWAMSAIVGAAGLPSTMALAEHSGTVALANKETMVCAGQAFRARANAHGTTILPVDSEHSAIFQCLAGGRQTEIETIHLTASGGPFRTWDQARIEAASVAEALAHPNWEMGQRITIDSASMFNKALEMIEAKELFDLSPDQVDVVVHPQSIIHSMVSFADGAVLAQLGAPDMRGPIGFALNHPERAELPVERLNFAKLQRLDFEAPDLARFPSLKLARDAMELGGAAGAVLNAAKEVALDAFLAGEISFGSMARIVAQTLELLADEAASLHATDGIEEILMLDARARGIGTDMAKRLSASVQQVS